MFHIMCTIFEYSLKALYTLLAIAAAVFLLDIFMYGITGMRGSFVLETIDLIIEMYGGASC
jgi:hypothetical protein